MSPQCNQILPCEFSSASYAQKVKMIEDAMDRVLHSQESETQGNRNKRALLSELKELHLYFAELAYYAINPSQFWIVDFQRR
ncbi:MAG TPA: hypothetical protein VFG04_03790 [Planctomycetaceae bacterium]|jgi:hypothetical protein|nr:hypothetical protein [Planctomycetaceae bacterium]